MAHIDQIVREYLLANPAISKAYSAGLVNRRALARKIIEGSEQLSKNNFEAVIASLRRMKSEKSEKANKKALSSFRVVVKDDIAIASLAKSKELLSGIERLMQKISYEKNDTFKVVVGTGSIKVFLDEKNISLLDSVASKKDILNVRKEISEISLQFGDGASSEKGILAYVSSALAISGISVEEFLTCSPELLIYLDEKSVLKAYECLKMLQK